MKKTIFTMVASAFMLGAILTSCSTPAEKVEDAQDNVVKANEDLDEANQEYLADIENYKKEVAAKIEANNKSIAEFKARKDNKKKEAKAEEEEAPISLPILIKSLNMPNW
jgi:F0F1-type ATP synthase membrane subunit b/b'